MLSYQHGYHAGALADVHKHSALSVLLTRLCEKPKPLTYMETHAGRGLYDLSSVEARKTSEAERGIQRLLAAGCIPAGHPYRRAIEAVRADYGPTCYPGSPLVAKTLLRPGDQLHLMELHPQEHVALRRNLQGPNIHIHRRDGFEGVLAVAPPTHRRGLVLVDPSYEVKMEYGQVAEFVIALHRKWPQAVILVWYPLLGAGLHDLLARRLETAGLPGYRRGEVRFAGGSGRPGIMGSGLILVNTPYGVEPSLDAAAAFVS